MVSQSVNGSEEKKTQKELMCVALFKPGVYLCVYVGVFGGGGGGGGVTPFFFFPGVVGGRRGVGWGGGGSGVEALVALSSLTASHRAKGWSLGCFHPRKKKKRTGGVGRGSGVDSVLSGGNFHLFFSPPILLFLQGLFFGVNTACTGGWDGVVFGGREEMEGGV